MSKIICDVCGTSYPDTANQCPICGCVRSIGSQGIENDEIDAQGGYTYVKGGRFSKSNVKKRSRSSYAEDYEQPEDQEQEEPREEKGGTGLLIVAILLLLAIIAVVIYIALNFFGPATPTPTDAPDVPKVTVAPQTTGAPQTTAPAVIPCQSIMLDASAVSLKSKNAVRMLYTSVLPANTTDTVTFTSSNELVARVDNTGKVIAVSPGQAVITVTCGSASFTCTVSCDFEDPTTATTVPPVTETTPPQEQLKLNRKDITFSSKGESWMLYSGNIAVSDITWTTGNDKIATIKNGKVTAVGSGTTTVYGEYNGVKAECIIRCAFEDESENPGVGGNGGVTEDGGTSDTTGEGYSLKNMAGGYNDDVTINVGYAFSLQLVDGQGNPVSSVAWSSSNDGICTVVDGKVTGVAAGTATVTAIYEGKEYKCVIRVN